MTLSKARQIVRQGKTAFMWTATLGNLDHHIAWSPDDRLIRISYEQHGKWTPFVTLGPQWSPASDLFAAQLSVEDWAEHREAKLKNVA
ncbi:MAG: hypothetical protein QG622_88 [Actinomycetota bacterium]|nr:hypothetical protein [Actinomycetota bacterium]